MSTASSFAPLLPRKQPLTPGAPWCPPLRTAPRPRTAASRCCKAALEQGGTDAWQQGESRNGQPEHSCRAPTAGSHTTRGDICVLCARPPCHALDTRLLQLRCTAGSSVENILATYCSQVPYRCCSTASVPVARTTRLPMNASSAHALLLARTSCVRRQRSGLRRWLQASPTARNTLTHAPADLAEHGRGAAVAPASAPHGSH